MSNHRPFFLLAAGYTGAAPQSPAQRFSRPAIARFGLSITGNFCCFLIHGKLSY
jgi:hypothetical protein